MRVYTSYMRFIWNLRWMREIYDYFCNDYVDDRPNDSIELLEKILFLMQIESIKKDKSPFIKYKVYIQNRKIRIPYISDLIRVFPIRCIGKFSWFIDEKMQIHIKRYNRYVKWSEEKIDDTIERIIREEKLPEKYFTYGIYKNRWFRRYARLKLRSAYGLRAIFKKALGISIISPPLFFIIPLFFVVYMITGEVRLKQDLFGFIVFTMYFGIIYIIWTCLWCRPTKFEIKNGYLEEFKNDNME